MLLPLTSRRRRCCMSISSTSNSQFQKLRSRPDLARVTLSQLLVRLELGLDCASSLCLRFFLMSTHTSQKYVAEGWADVSILQATFLGLFTKFIPCGILGINGRLVWGSRGPFLVQVAPPPHKYQTMCNLWVFYGLWGL